VKLELRATLLQFLCDAYDPRKIHGIRIVLVLRTHNETLFETAAGFTKTVMATQAFRYGRLNFLMARGQFDIICDMESISRTSEHVRSLQQLTGSFFLHRKSSPSHFLRLRDETEIRQEIAKAQQRANEPGKSRGPQKSAWTKTPTTNAERYFGWTQKRKSFVRTRFWTLWWLS